MRYAESMLRHNLSLDQHPSCEQSVKNQSLNMWQLSTFFAVVKSISSEAAFNSPSLHLP